MKAKSHLILSCVLIKMEKLFNQSAKEKYFYNLELEGIDEPLLLEVEKPLTSDLQGKKIKYKLNSDNEVSEFELI